MPLINLSETLILTFEIGEECNLKQQHANCPISQRTYRIKKKALTVDKIIECIHSAKTLGFDGLIGFHYYNEPLLSMDKILKVIERADHCRFLLWTNGLLLNAYQAQLDKFFAVVISCYDKKHLNDYKNIQSRHPHVFIMAEQFDARKDIYQSQRVLQFNCKRPLFELPIDYYGNVHLCCIDWDNQYEIGNVNESSLASIVCAEAYQKALNMGYRNLYDCTDRPDICKHCFKYLLRYSKRKYLCPGIEGEMI